MPRVTTWKVPLAFFLTGFVAKVALSILVSDTVGSWVGGTLGFFAFVTTWLYAWNQSCEVRGQERTPHPEP
jgi:hypothetical protein